MYIVLVCSPLVLSREDRNTCETNPVMYLMVAILHSSLTLVSISLFHCLFSLRSVSTSFADFL